MKERVIADESYLWYKNKQVTVEVNIPKEGDFMTVPNSHGKRRLSTRGILYWALVIFLIVMALWSLSGGDMTGFIGFLIFAACTVIVVYPPKWFQRFAGRADDTRGD